MASNQIPNSNQVATDSTGLFTVPWFMYFQGLYKQVRSSLKLKLSGVLEVNITPASNIDAAQTDLISYSLQSNTMVNNGDVFEIKGRGIFASNGNNKTITLEFGGQEIYNSTALAINGGSWIINAEIIRLTSSTQEIFVESSLNGTVTNTRTAGTQDLNQTNIIKFTGTGAVSDDITQLINYTGLTPND